MSFKKLKMSLIFFLFMIITFFMPYPLYAMKKVPIKEESLESVHRITKKSNAVSQKKKSSLQARATQLAHMFSKSSLTQEEKMKEQPRHKSLENVPLIKIPPATPEKRSHAIQTEHLIIAPTYAEDVKVLFEKKIIWRCTSTIEKEYTEERQAYQNCPDMSSLKITDYSIFLKEGGDLMGKFNFLVNLFKDDEFYNNTIFTDLGLSPDNQGKGYGTEMLQAVSEQIIKPLIGKNPMVYLFNREGNILNMGTDTFPIKLTHVYAKISGSNEASIKLHKKCGWTFFKKHENEDIFFYTYPKIEKASKTKINRDRKVGVKKKPLSSLKRGKVRMSKLERMRKLISKSHKK